jgi:hypothetical protein
MRPLRGTANHVACGMPIQKIQISGSCPCAATLAQQAETSDAKVQQAETVDNSACGPPLL